MERVIVTKQDAIKIDNEHSMEFVATLNDVTFINDSKSTTAKLSAENINSIDVDIVLILGGDDRKTDYSWFSLIKNHNIKTIIYFGRRIAEIKNIFNKHTMIILADDLEMSVEISRSKSILNQVVLFSPACPSYDAFDNYKNRGNKFKELVLKNNQ